MARTRKAILGGIRTRERIQDEILEKFGKAVLRKARQRLCLNCGVEACFLFPITTQGKDCPYFKEREVRE